MEHAEQLPLTNPKTGEVLIDFSQLSQNMLRRSLDYNLQKKLLTYEEVDYHISMFKNKDIDSAEYSVLLEKAIFTLRVLMVKLGMD